MKFLRTLRDACLAFALGLAVFAPAVATPTVTLSQLPKLRFVDNNGIACSGCKVFTYAAGTTTKQNSYTDSTGTTPNANPVILDSRGEAAVWLDQSLSYKVVLAPSTDSDPPGNAFWTIDNISSIGGQLSLSSGATLVGFIQQGAGAVARTSQDKLREVVSVTDFAGCDATGSSSSSTCFTSALATGKDVYVPAGTFKLTTPVTSSTFNQTIYGAGRAASLVSCALTSSGNCITFTGSSGNQTIRNLSITTSNTSTVKLVDLQSPQVRILDSYLQNTATAGYGVYAENENSGAGLFVFGAQIIGNTITAAGGSSSSVAVRLGLNSQTALIKGNILENASSAILIEGANEASVIEENVLENVQFGLNITGSGTVPFWDISVRKNYFEAVTTACVQFGGTGGVFSNFNISDNYATSGGGTVYFFSAPNSAVSGLSNGLKVENNYIQNFTAAFNLVDGVTSQTATSLKGNTFDTTPYATGTNSVNAYTTRVINPYFNNVLVSGSFASKGVNRMEMSAGDYQIPLRVEPREYVDSIQFKYTAVGTTSMTATLYKLLSTADTPTSVSTTSGTTSGTYTLAFGGFPAANYNYYVEVVMTLNGGTTAYVYPLILLLRQ